MQPCWIVLQIRRPRNEAIQDQHGRRKAVFRQPHDSYESGNFDKINALNLKTGVSFNKIVNQCIEYALANYEEDQPEA